MRLGKRQRRLLASEAEAGGGAGGRLASFTSDSSKGSSNSDDHGVLVPRVWKHQGVETREPCHGRQPTRSRLREDPAAPAASGGCNSARPRPWPQTAHGPQGLRSVLWGPRGPRHLSNLDSGRGLPSEACGPCSRGEAGRTSHSHPGGRACPRCDWWPNRAMWTWGPAVRASLVKSGLPGTSTPGAGLWVASVLSAPRGLKSRSCPLVWESPSVRLWRREAPHVHCRSAPSPAGAGRLAAAPGRRDRTAGPGGGRRGSYHKPGITRFRGAGSRRTSSSWALCLQLCSEGAGLPRWR